MLELKGTITIVKLSMDGLNSKETSIEITQSEQQKIAWRTNQKVQKNNFRDL